MELQCGFLPLKIFSFNSLGLVINDPITLFIGLLQSGLYQRSFENIIKYLALIIEIYN